MITSRQRNNNLQSPVIIDKQQVFLHHKNLMNINKAFNLQVMMAYHNSVSEKTTVSIL